MVATSLAGYYIEWIKDVEPSVWRHFMQPKSKLSRRTLFAGAGTAGALSAAAVLLPSVLQPAAPAPSAKQPPAAGGGYHLSEHVKRYYQTTLV